MIVTIDGPAGTGKSTVAKRVSEALGYSYFDTGAMYRMLAWQLLKENIALTDVTGIQRVLERFRFKIHKKQGCYRYFVVGEEVTQAIRTPEVTAYVSPLSALAEVRTKLWQLQRAYAKRKNAVFEGRDMGSVVFPHAEVKIFLTASASVRAQRRLNEMRTTHPHLVHDLTREEMQKEIEARDDRDSSRLLAPLTCPPDALVIDTTTLQVDEVVAQIASIARQRPTLLYRMILALAKGWFSLFYRHKVYGAPPTFTAGALLAANHTSFLDPPVLAISWKREVHFLARKTLFRNKIFASLIRSLNTHPVSGSASDISVIKMVCDLLRSGDKIVIFPEGTRSATQELGRIKSGITLFMMRSGCVIVPAYIHGTFDIWPRGRKWPKLFGKTACVFGSPLTLPKGENAEALIAERLRLAILALKKWYEEGAKGPLP